MLEVKTNTIQLRMDDNNLKFSFGKGDTEWNWTSEYRPKMECKEGTVYFDEALEIHHELVQNGIGKGIRSSFAGFEIEGKKVPYAFETYAWIEECTEDIFFEWIPICEEGLAVEKLFWPGELELEEKRKDWYTLLNMQQGVMIPNDWETELKDIPFDGFFETAGEAMQIPPTIFPKKFLTDAYSSIVTALPFGRVYLNTIISTVVTTVVQVLFCSMAAYAFARIEFPFKNAIFVLVLSVLMVPGQIFLIPQYRIVQSLGLLDTIPALFLPNLFSAFGTFLLRQFFMSLPKELEEAALLDGCNRFQIFGRIMLPLTKAGIVSLVIFTAKFAWNDFMWPLIVNTSMDKMTLGPALSTLQGQYTTKYPMQMAGAVMAVIPIIVLFFIFQKQFIEGVAQSGIKG